MCQGHEDGPPRFRILCTGSDAGHTAWDTNGSWQELNMYIANVHMFKWLEILWMMLSRLMEELSWTELDLDLAGRWWLMTNHLTTRWLSTSGLQLEVVHDLLIFGSSAHASYNIPCIISLTRLNYPSDVLASSASPYYTSPLRHRDDGTPFQGSS